jgi:hypothetical protein
MYRQAALPSHPALPGDKSGLELVLLELGRLRTRYHLKNYVFTINQALYSLANIMTTLYESELTLSVVLESNSGLNIT